MTDAGTLEGVQLWDGEAYRGRVTIRWSGGGIDTIEPTAETVPVSDLCVIPGLVDTHVHLIGNASDQPADFLGWPLVTRPEEQVLHGLAHAQRALRGGVTTLRDLSADEVQFSLVRALRAGIIEGPRVLAHGLVGMTGGHGDLFIPPAVAQRKPVADGADACRALVRHWARAGADGIKITTSGGVLSVGDKAAWRNYTRDEIAAIVDEAHALGMRVAAHAHTAEGIEVAIEESVDSIEHATLVEPAQAARIAERGMTVAPTLLINDRIAAGRMANAEQAAKARDLVVERDSRFRAAAEAGVDFVLGTDANGAHVEFREQMTEVRRMAEIFGWTAERALQAATSRAARAIGLDGVTGVVRSGAAADLVVLRGRPWERIEDLDVAHIVEVVAGGRRLSSTRG